MTNQEYVKIVADFDKAINDAKEHGDNIYDSRKVLDRELEKVKKRIEELQDGRSGFEKMYGQLYGGPTIDGSTLISSIKGYDEDKRNIRKDFPI